MAELAVGRQQLVPAMYEVARPARRAAAADGRWNTRGDFTDVDTEAADAVDSALLDSRATPACALRSRRSSGRRPAIAASRRWAAVSSILRQSRWPAQTPPDLEFGEGDRRARAAASGGRPRAVVSKNRSTDLPGAASRNAFATTRDLSCNLLSAIDASAGAACAMACAPRDLARNRLTQIPLCARRRARRGARRLGGGGLGRNCIRWQRSTQQLRATLRSASTRSRARPPEQARAPLGLAQPSGSTSAPTALRRAAAYGEHSRRCSRCSRWAASRLRWRPRRWGWEPLELARDAAEASSGPRRAARLPLSRLLACSSQLGVAPPTATTRRRRGA